MVRRVPTLLCAFLAALMLLGSVSVVALPAAGAQETSPDLAAPDTTTSGDAASYVDDQLHRLLVEAGLVDVWVRASGVSESAALVEVLGDEAYQLGYQVLLNDLERLGQQRAHDAERAASADQLTTDVDSLGDLIRTLRRDVLATNRSAARSLTPSTADHALSTLAAISGSHRWFDVSLDPLVRAEQLVAAVRDDVRSEVEELRSPGQRQKSREAAVVRLTAAHSGLERVRALIDTASQGMIVGQFEYAGDRDAVVETFEELHRLRLLRPSSVGGLSVVTLDAYVRGADALDAACPVDWALLAGIGRVESRHGTIDDTTVQRSGRVTKNIFGPLLDGGATEREAIQAAADAAVAAAAAEEELRLAEIEAEEPEIDFDESLWGDAVQRVKETEERLAADDGVGLAAPPPPEVEEAPPARFDPLLWGDDLPFDDEDLEDLDEVDVEEDEEEPEFRGNGFAVIRDSDNGRLDGNNRWDRAVGPMQFIPETWAYWETDGNDDGVIDPQNLYDAAATAGQFLCHLSRTRGASPSSFVLGYNSSQTYVRNVMAVADAFGANELPTADAAGT